MVCSDAEDLYKHQDGKNNSASEDERLRPTILVAILVRNKAHVLPWFFGQFENLNYPKDRIALWIRSDHNVDNSSKMLREWIAANRQLYHSIDFILEEDSRGYSDERGPCDWSEQRFENVIKLRQQALEASRSKWADYLFMLDADVMLQNDDALNILIQQKKPIVAPMLNASIGETYSNFWGGVDEEGYYKRVPEYFDIVGRKISGCFVVPMVHSAILIDMRLRDSQKLSYIPSSYYRGPKDDIIIFGNNARSQGVNMYILNTAYFGRMMVPLDWYHNLFTEREQFVYMKNEAIDADNPSAGDGVDFKVEGAGYIKSPHISVKPHPADKMGFDEVYLINLVRRQERRKRMLLNFEELQIMVKIIDAVDGKQLNDSYIKEKGIEMLPGFADPYHGRPLKMGEIGCFLSHYIIWEDVVKNNYQKVVVFEDDIRFEPYFRTKLEALMVEAGTKVPDWDLIYLGRKRLNLKDEFYVTDSQTLVWPSYSYWTLSYLLSLEGAKKLLQQRPLQRMIPVDEYLPVMFDKHPDSDWKTHFSPRNLVSLSAEPLLVYPTHYLGEPHYISDTEDSQIIQSGDESNENEVVKDEL
ncbi:hypothetical protein ACJMK2_038772 [Sinanodonta woodiana]|uniref:Glycosyl transferase family 25 domain-containing protein n=1 Tax=Sinanodonta woodiana TaxID=1069815 RepID=A0ABD3WD61_SINWO